MILDIVKSYSNVRVIGVICHTIQNLELNTKKLPSVTWGFLPWMPWALQSLLLINYSIVHPGPEGCGGGRGQFAPRIMSTVTKECCEFGSTTASYIHVGCLRLVLQIANFSLVDLRADFADFALWTRKHPDFPHFHHRLPEATPESASWPS